MESEHAVERPLYRQRVVFAEDPRLAAALEQVLGGRAVREILNAADPKPPIRKGTS
jgi:hypothetical protein